MKRRSIVAANWKMNGNLALVSAKVEEFRNLPLSENLDVVICPGFPYLVTFGNELDKKEHPQIFTGAQNVSEFSEGAYTGEVSAQILREVGAQYVIVGHSERRQIFAESSELVAKKVKAALTSGLKPILCIGETEVQRISQLTERVLASQLKPVIDTVGIESFKDIIVAYEPIWAIGTGNTASAELAQETHHYIRSYLAKHDEMVAEKVLLLYGGSVNPTNCEDIFAQDDIDGGLIGGASLKVDEFKMICSAMKGT